ncbi:hypothetical protein Ccrd_025772 [Cynara cardunculus var. scolymus]|uniref:Uncharacterized protein n=1 Tax=Cynara cardunculus var. scolymus TaxID=59895 RepID=A0A103XDK7_CYNCS|nr:hypothetical protein Ccrd_025772 [Cynara cardunculus var. scolymus]
MVDVVIDFLLENLKEILSCSHDFVLEGKDAIKSLYDDLKSITTFLKDPQILTVDLQVMVERFQQMAYAMLDLMDSSAIIAINKKKENRPMPHSSLPRKKKHDVLRVFNPSDSKLLVDFKKEVSSIKKALMDDIDNTKLDNLRLGSGTTTPYASGYQIGGTGSSVYDKDIFVGFEQQEATVKDRLVGVLKKRQIISIVGMGGIGKTTLAKRLYDDSYITYHFHVRGWTCVSQNYQKKDLLLSILESVVDNEDQLHGACENKLAEKLYKCLYGRRYLIVVDDIWDVKAWEDLIRCFPDDNNGSRIMITTRLEKVAMEIAKPEVPPHFMSFLSQDESWDLLQKRVFKRRDECPLELVDLGQQIAAKCHGLALAIVIVGGILEKIERKKERWTEVSERLSSYITTDDAEQQLMAILGQSYDHLPSHLKPCFVYFGAFPEDYEIVVWRLILLWIAEGFVVETGDRSLTYVAEEYLKDLVGRSLVVVSKRSSRKGVKSCRMHDMLRAFCLEKAKEMKFEFRQQIDWYGRVASPATPPILEGPPLCFHSHGYHDGEPCFPHLRSTLSSPISYIYKLLRVLNLWAVYLDTFPEEIFKLFHLRFLEIRVRHLDSLPSEISNLWNLEVLIINKENWGRVCIPRSFWSLVKLRHLSISEEIEFEPPSASHGYPPLLESLQCISALPASKSRMDIKPFFKRTPNLKRVVFYRGPRETKQIILPSLANLIQLDSFKLIDNSYGQPHLIIPRTSSFPQNLKKIALSGGQAEWKEMSKLGKLPNLEILKLRRNSFSGPLWETNDGEFSRLKYLKLSFMDLERWICSTSIHFPNLQQLLIERCQALLEIPSSLGDVATLETIEVSWSSHSVSDSALKIQKEQQNDGNDGLKVLVSNRIGEDDGTGILKSFLEDERRMRQNQSS